MKKGLKITLVILAGLAALGSFIEDEPKKKTEQKNSKVENSSWDGSVYQVKVYLKSHVNDPKSLEYYNWYEVKKIPGKERYRTRVDFGARNGFGGMVRSTGWFTFDSKGIIVDVVIK